MTEPVLWAEAQRIDSFLRSRFPTYADDLQLDAPLERHVDSLGLFDLVEWVESTYAIRIPTEAFSPRRFASVRSILLTVNEFRPGGLEAATA
jgi:acyl carrier protein